MSRTGRFVRRHGVRALPVAAFGVGRFHRCAHNVPTMGTRMLRSEVTVAEAPIEQVTVDPVRRRARTVTRGAIAAALVLGTLLGPWGAAAPAQESYAIYGAERYFALDWGTFPGRGGQTTVAGHVTNTWGWPARDVRLRVEGLDSAGRVLTTTTAHVYGVVMPGSSSYFEVDVPGGAARYRVSVLSFDWRIPTSTLHRAR